MPVGGKEAVSPDGASRVRIQGDGIRVYRADLEPERQQRLARDRAFLERPARFDPDWHQRQLDESLAAHDDFAAAFHLERLTRGQPWDATLHVHSAHLLARLGRREESVIHLAQALLLNPRVSLWAIDDKAAQRGEHAAQQGKWSLAVRDFLVASHQPQPMIASLTNLLLARAATDDTAGVRQTMADLARRLEKEKDAETAATIFYWSLLAPGRRRRLCRSRSMPGGMWHANAATPPLDTAGAALYRVGKYEDAERTLSESIKAHGKGGYTDTWLFQAMTARRLGKYDEASRLLAPFENWHRQQTFPTWQQRVYWAVLLREARQLITTPPAMPRADEQK